MGFFFVFSSPLMFTPSFANNTSPVHVNLDRKLHGTSESVMKQFTCSLAKNLTTTHLSLRNNALWAEIGHYLGECLMVNNTLEMLDLSNNEISDEGVVGLAKGLRLNHSLRKLVLHNNSITDSGAILLIKALESNHTLEELDLHWNMVSDEVFSQIKRATTSRSKTVLDNEKDLLEVSKLNDRVQVLSQSLRDCTSELKKEKERVQQSKASQRRYQNELKQQIDQLQAEVKNLSIANAQKDAQLEALKSVHQQFAASQDRIHQLQTTLKDTSQLLNTLEESSTLDHSLLKGLLMSIEDCQQPKPSSHVDEDQLCKICQESIVEIVILPCGHLILCDKCSSKVSNCPFCRCKITQVVRIFRQLHC